MKVDIQLYSVLREKLPIDARGRTVLKLEDGSTIEDLLIKLDIERKVVISVNGVQEQDKTRLLHDGDKIKLFSSVSGGLGDLHSRCLCGRRIKNDARL